MNGLTYIYIYIMYRGVYVVSFVYIVYFGTSHKSSCISSIEEGFTGRNRA